jgi:hypothetical protein
MVATDGSPPSPRTSDETPPSPRTSGDSPPSPRIPSEPIRVEPITFGDQLERWLDADGEKTLGSLIAAFREKSFAVLFVLLLGVPALPLPTGGATHVFEVIAVLIALQLIVGRHEIWLPKRWRALSLGGEKQQRFLTSLMRFVRRVERLSRPRLTILFRHRAGDVAFGLLVIVGAVAAFLAPPFSGLDTLPALGVVVLSLGVLLEDALVAAAGVALLITGVVLEVVLGAAAIHGISSLL